MATHRRFHLLGNILHFHKFSHETNGTYCLVEARVAPGAGAPPNRHPGEEEAFVVLEGQFEFLLGDRTIRVTGGDSVTIPSGALHAFTNVGDTPGRLMIFNAPGAVHDAFFAGLGDPVDEGSWDFPAPDGPPDIPALIAAAKQTGVEIVAG
ncbi:cupin domain-containing protein [Rhodobacter sp. NTK016B]|uniref:cupin domain-containing protein n=1 Tax=Rhodobacter sp. NTK016B TaxID=2759676 RepID=UPI001A8D1C72|nr:cupin domain-containing protein [Rhodobacter sp. NTK016B]MBN8293612.1 cupin domain-containing protein [Rhodobacter sp. NTK016B]